MSWLNAFITANLIGIASNLDNCGTGIAYGSENVKFPNWVNVVVNLIGFGTGLLGAYLGGVIAHFITFNQASWAACIVLVSIGLYFMYAQYVHKLLFKRREQISVQRPGWKQGIILGFALSFTNIAVGFGATVSNAATIWTTALSIAVWGYIMIWLGNVIGIGIVARFLGRYASLVAGVLLILVGLHQVVRYI